MDIILRTSRWLESITLGMGAGLVQGPPSKVVASAQCLEILLWRRPCSPPSPASTQDGSVSPQAPGTRFDETAMALGACASGILLAWVALRGGRVG